MSIFYWQKIFPRLQSDIPNFRKESRIENYENAEPAKVDVFYPPTLDFRLETLPSVTGKVKMMNAEMTRLFTQNTGISKRKEFKHIPNEKISSFNILKGTIKMMVMKLSKGYRERSWILACYRLKTKRTPWGAFFI